MNSEEDFYKHQSDKRDTIRRDICELNTKYKIGVEKRDSKPQKKESNRYPGNKNFPYSNKKQSGRPPQQTRTNGRQKIRLEDKKERA
jgi:hypothetical protein